ncbi:MAG: hypothetical protein OXH32_13275 [Acidobacteria bacterium]|nr:hypothetical protein [Acidobacteriota bacterium]
MESRTKARSIGKALLAVLIGFLVGAGFNAMLGDQGADTPALALLGGALGFGVFLFQARRRARKAQP